MSEINVRRVLRAIRRRVSPGRSVEGRVIALHKYRALYFPVPKVANSSLKAVCVDLLEIPVPEGTWKPWVFKTTDFDHLYDRKSVFISTTSAERMRDYWKFAFVRNPWDRLVSSFHEKIRRGRGRLTRIMQEKGILTGEDARFEDFAKAVAEIPDERAERHIRSQHRYLTNRRGELLPDFVGRFERLSEDFASVARHLGVEMEMPHLLKSQRGPYQEHYSDGLRDLIGERYRRDIDLFHYEF